jgi:hypothetical protein
LRAGEIALRLFELPAPKIEQAGCPEFECHESVAVLANCATASG